MTAVMDGPAPQPPVPGRPAKRRRSRLKIAGLIGAAALIGLVAVPNSALGKIGPNAKGKFTGKISPANVPVGNCVGGTGNLLNGIVLQAKSGGKGKLATGGSINVSVPGVGSYVLNSGNGWTVSVPAGTSAPCDSKVVATFTPNPIVGGKATSSKVKFVGCSSGTPTEHNKNPCTQQPG
jgi:hypothetical protein